MRTLTFLGAAGTVTGSKYWIQNGAESFLVDCGLFQGQKALRLKNWEPFPLDPKTLDAVVLTHAHMDHSGFLPLLVRNGFLGKILCTASTERLCRILLPDSGRLQEEEADYANHRGFSKHHPALPLYTEKEAQTCLNYFHPLHFHEEFRLGSEIRGQLTPAGHILGAACVKLEVGSQHWVFSGDLGRQKDLLMNPPEPIREADYLILESTYGSRFHDTRDPLVPLAEVIHRTVAREGVLLVPSFAIGRTQSLLYGIYQLKKENKIPNVPVFLNSPMAEDATEVFCNYQEEHRLTPEETLGACGSVHYVHSLEESKAINKIQGSMILIASSGMLSGGRILHHLRVFGSDSRNTILLTGFQAAGTRGDSLLRGARHLKIHGQMIPIKAEVVTMESFSAHADQNEILKWLEYFKEPPKTTFLVHGEPEASASLKLVIEKRLGWKCHLPQLMEKVNLGTSVSDSQL
jgi:metallo-beta-lactamase family protein